MEQHFIPYETGIPQQMHELGFNETCLGMHSRREHISLNPDFRHVSKGSWVLRTHNNGDKKDPNYSPAPMFCQAQEWLRETHKMSLEVHLADSGNYVFCLYSIDNYNSRIWQDGNWPYYEALTKGLEKAIEIINKRKNS